MQKNLKKILLISVPIFTLVFIFPTPTYGGLLDVLNPINWIKWAIMGILYIISYIGTLFFSLASYLVGFFLKLNYGILESNNLIERGWAITRDIANLGFVLVIVIISLATILRFQEYGYKKLLPKLIAAAILVNFSLTIAGVFMGFSDALTKQFFGAIGESESGIVSTLSGAFEPQKFYTEPTEPAPFDQEEETGGLETFTVSALLDIAKLLFTVIFIFAAAFTLLAFAFMLLLRYIYLSFLLVIAPIAWLFWVFPALAGQFRKWWNKFLEWVFFMPVVAFFLYLTLTSIKSLNQNAILADGTFFKASMADLMVQGAKMVLLIGLLFGGLIIAQQMGITGAAGAMRMANTVGNKTKKWAGDKMKAGGIAVGRRALSAGAAGHEEGKSYGERLGENIGGRLAQWGSTKWGKRFGIGALSKPFIGIAGASAQAKEKLKAEAEAKAKKLAPESSGLALVRLNQELGKYGPIRDSRNIVSNYEKVTQDQQLWNSLTPEQQNEFNQMALEAGRQTNSTKRVATANASLAAQPGTLTDQEFAKAFPEMLKSIDKLPDTVQQAIFQRAAGAALGLRDDHPDALPLYTAIKSNEEAWNSLSAILRDELNNKAEAAAPHSSGENRIKAALVNPELTLRPNLLSADEMLKFGAELRKSPQYEKMADTTRTDINQLIAQAAVVARNDHPEIISTLTTLRQSDDWDTFSAATQNALINKMIAVGSTANRDAKLNIAALDPAKLATTIGFTTDKDFKDIAERIKEPAHISIEDPATLTPPQLNAQIKVMQYLSFSQHGKIGSEGTSELKTNTVKTLAEGISRFTNAGVFNNLKTFTVDLKKLEEDFEAAKRINDKPLMKQIGQQINSKKTNLETEEKNLKTASKDAHQLWETYKKNLKDTNYQDATWS
ncbi:MAG: hypothetical protein QMD50_02305 [Patescibacteria group bacterium]|nr:hypothetical protein [Patescibacteria group bacterium]